MEVDIKYKNSQTSFLKTFCNCD